MSISVMTWVWTHSRSRNGARLVLLAIADSANDNGRNAWPSVKTLRTKANLSERAVQNAIQDLIELGELKVEWNKGPHGSNLYSILMRSTPAESAPPQIVHPADIAGVENDPEPDVKPQDPPQNLHPAESAPPQNSTGTPAESAPEPSMNRPSKKKTKSSSTSTTKLQRDDAERICLHLAERIEGNGSRRPPITDAWRTEARLMLDKDKRTEADVHAAIDWCQDSTFWRGNVLSLPKLREKYDQLRLQAIRERTPPPPRNNGPDWEAAMARAEARDAAEEAASEDPEDIPLWKAVSA